MTDAEWTDLEARHKTLRDRWIAAHAEQERIWDEFQPVLEPYNHEKQRRELIAELKKEGAV